MQIPINQANPSEVIISFESCDSFISEIHKICEPYRHILNEKRKMYVPNEDSTYALDCLFSINKYGLDTFEMESLYTGVKHFLEKCSFEFFHNTRLVTLEDLYENGLSPLSKEKYISRMTSILLMHNYSQEAIENALAKIDPYLCDKQGNRSNRIAFYAPFTQFDFWIKFCLNVGGEVAEFPLKVYHPETYKFLTQIGHPYCIKVNLDWADIDISGFTEQKLVLTVLKLYFAAIYIGKKYNACIDCVSKNHIGPKKITEIIDVADSIKK